MVVFSISSFNWVSVPNSKKVNSRCPRVEITLWHEITFCWFFPSMDSSCVSTWQWVLDSRLSYALWASATFYRKPGRLRHMSQWAALLSWWPLGGLPPFVPATLGQPSFQPLRERFWSQGFSSICPNEERFRTPESSKNHKVVMGEWSPETSHWWKTEIPQKVVAGISIGNTTPQMKISGRFVLVKYENSPRRGVLRKPHLQRVCHLGIGKKSESNCQWLMKEMVPK